MAVFIWFVTNGGRFNLTMNDVGLGGVTVPSFSLTLDNGILIYITLGLCLLKGLLGILEYRSYRNELNGGKAA